MDFQLTRLFLQNHTIAQIVTNRHTITYILEQNIAINITVNDANVIIISYLLLL